MITKEQIQRLKELYEKSKCEDPAIIRSREIFHGYEVMPDGRVISPYKWRGKPRRTLKPYENSYGYHRVKLHLGDGKFKTYMVHKMVAELYLDPAEGGKTQIRHLDGDPKNNYYKNLKWGTAKENAEDRDRHGKTYRGSKNGNSKLSVREVVVIRILHNSGVENIYLSNMFKVSRETIDSICSSKSHIESEFPMDIFELVNMLPDLLEAAEHWAYAANTGDIKQQMVSFLPLKAENERMKQAIKKAYEELDGSDYIEDNYGQMCHAPECVKKALDILSPFIHECSL